MQLKESEKEIIQSNLENCKVINKRFLCHLNLVIGSGTFGKVLYATSLDRKVEYAIKFEKSNVKSSVIELEYEIYLNLQDGEGIPKIIWMGEYKKYKLMVMEVLGPSLDKFFIACDKRFNVNTMSSLGEEMLKRVEYVHSKGYVHRDIKPNNFMLGKFSTTLDNINDKTVYIIDFGLSKQYVDIDKETSVATHLPLKDGRRFIGTPRYASINTHLGLTQSRRDDIESIAYILIYFLLGELPWQGIKAKTKIEKKEIICKMKQQEDFTKYLNVPKELLIFLDYSKSLQYESKPNYEYLYGLLNKISINYKIKNTFSKDKENKGLLWEWNEKFLISFEKKINTSQQEEVFKKLYDGYPFISFDDYVKQLSNITLNYSNVNLLTNSSTTSNTNQRSQRTKDEIEIISEIDKMKLNK
jgi:serine/threonine protein kinase